MGVERAVTRWHLQRQQILHQIATLEAKLAGNIQAQESAGSSNQAEAELMQHLANAQEKLRTLGPCPKPMMG